MNSIQWHCIHQQHSENCITVTDWYGIYEFMEWSHGVEWSRGVECFWSGFLESECMSLKVR